MHKKSMNKHIQCRQNSRVIKYGNCKQPRYILGSRCTYKHLSLFSLILSWMCTLQHRKLKILNTQDIGINFSSFIITAKGVLIPKYIIAFCFSFIPVILDIPRCQILIYLAQWWSVSTVQPHPQAYVLPRGHLQSPCPRPDQARISQQMEAALGCLEDPELLLGDYSLIGIQEKII